MTLNEFFEQSVELNKGVQFKFLDNSNSHIGAFICKKIQTESLDRNRTTKKIKTKGLKNWRTKNWKNRWLNNYLPYKTLKNVHTKKWTACNIRLINVTPLPFSPVQFQYNCCSTKETNRSSHSDTKKLLFWLLWE